MLHHMVLREPRGLVADPCGPFGVSRSSIGWWHVAPPPLCLRDLSFCLLLVPVVQLAKSEFLSPF